MIIWTIYQIISHNGVCLTVVRLTDDTYTVTAMKETLERSNLGLLKVGDKVNVEPVSYTHLEKISYLSLYLKTMVISGLEK